MLIKAVVWPLALSGLFASSALAAPPEASPWKRLGTPFGAGTPVAFVAEGKTIFARFSQPGGIALHVSLDGGAKWRKTHAKTPDPSGYVARSVAVLGKVVLAVVDDHQLVRSQDGGKTWAPVAHFVGQSVRQGVATRGKMFVAALGRSVVESKDGKVWTELARAPGLIDQIFAAGDDVFVGTQEFAFDYDPEFDDSPPVTFHRNGCPAGPCDKDAREWVAMERHASHTFGSTLVAYDPKASGTVPERYVSNDGGRAWTAIPARSGEDFVGDWASSFYAYFEGQLQQSDDHGVTWRPLVAGPVATDFDNSAYCANPVLVGRTIIVSCERDKALPTELFAYDLGKAAK